MMFGRRDHESELERKLRATRPKAPDDLLQRLTGLVEARAPAPRRLLIPRVILVCAASAVIALSLGVVGAVGSATGSIHAFGRGVVHLVQAPSTTSPSVATTTSSVQPHPSQGGSGRPDPGFLPGRIHDLQIPPFGFQYGITVPICFNGHVIFVPISQLLWYFYHGGLPVRDCFLRR